MELNKFFNKNQDYIHYYEKENVIDKTFLLEAGQGKNINGNIYAILNELRTKPEWEKYKVYLVVCEDTMESAKQRIEFYKYKNVDLVIRDTKFYKKLLATCKFLITDNSFPPYFIKKDNQVLLNTWHGTPLKTLGRCDIQNSSSIANVQKNMVMSDYILFPNQYTKNIFLEDYCLKNILNNKIVLSDYPRNVAFYNENMKKQIKEKYNLFDKEIFAYMPTWRGTSRKANILEQKKIILNYLDQIDKELKDNQILYVNLHFLIGNSIDLSNYKHIKIFPKEYETYDFLNVCDILITDYSSVFFDFAVTKKKIILFTYDLEEYIADRGMYFSIEELPFPRVSNVKGLIKELNNKIDVDYSEFYNKFCNYTSKDAVKNILNLLVNEESESIFVEHATKSEKENVLIHVSKIKTSHQLQFVIDYLSKFKEDKNYILLFYGKLTNNMIELIKNTPEYIQVYGYVVKNEFTNLEKIIVSLSSHFTFVNYFTQNIRNRIFRREFKRRFCNIKVDKCINLFDNSHFMIHELEFFDCPKSYVNFRPEYMGLLNNKKWYKDNLVFEKNHYECINVDSLILDNQKEKTFFNINVAFLRLCSKTKVNNNEIEYAMWLISNSVVNFDFEDINFYLDNQLLENEVSTVRKIPFSKYLKLFKIKITIDKDEILSLPLQNKLLIKYIDENGLGFEKLIRYSFRLFEKHLSHSRIININDEICCYFRKTKGNSVYLTVRNHNVTDSKFENLKLNIAYYISKLFKKKRIILLFEKDSSKYEESGSVVYEYLIDHKYNNAYFILDKNYSGISQINKKYKKNIIYKYTFKHYLYFFICQTFIGTEALIHALELRCNNSYVLKKESSPDIDYVFLQHGVMYMISLDSESRTFFKPRSIHQKGKYRVVTSSVAEANHFIEFGNHDESQVIVCGLPKFDRNIWYDIADKIVIMLTWRPWEYNEALNDFKTCNYYKILVRIYNSIPDNYKSKLIILPHPLFYHAAQNNDFELKEYMRFDVKYDEILRETKLLITDYSSIAYDAFYRGCNVIFYWEELDECLEHYGPSTKLMLNRSNVFGDVCMNNEELKRVIDENYINSQSNFYFERYSKLVEYHDGKNTERLINRLKDEQII
ncbi:MAG: CDP-glycerol glycerophosphotransferase family protein [Erysipelotrichaceae bacterium]|nr:CDP-glycerol glycerophosphotransferase family protein [Erysipelotrichaceae bacterium]